MCRSFDVLETPKQIEITFKKLRTYWIWGMLDAVQFGIIHYFSAFQKPK
jgi:hypothetical protein